MFCARLMLSPLSQTTMKLMIRLVKRGWWTSTRTFSSAKAAHSCCPSDPFSHSTSLSWWSLWLAINRRPTGWNSKTSASRTAPSSSPSATTTYSPSPISLSPPKKALERSAGRISSYWRNLTSHWKAWSYILYTPSWSPRASYVPHSCTGEILISDPFKCSWCALYSHWSAKPPTLIRSLKRPSGTISIDPMLAHW